MVFDDLDVAVAYDRFRSRSTEVSEFWIPTITQTAEIRPRERILDVGCGTGRIAVPLAEDYFVLGVDRSWEMLAVARSKLGNAQFVRADAAALPIVDGRFDLALCIMLLHHVPSIEAVVREAARVAQRLLVGTIDMERRTPHALDEAFPSVARIDGTRFPRIDDVSAACETAGYRNVTVRAVERRVESSTDEFLERVRARYVSTLSLIPLAEFARGLAWLESELPRRGPRYAYDHTVTIVAASA